MKKLIVLTAVVLAGFGGRTSTADARSSAFNDAKVRYYHADGIVKWIGKHAKITQYHPDPKKKHHWQKAVAFYVKVRKEAWLVMHPKPRYTAGHWTGWSCITHGPHFNNTGYHEGNGYNGSYTGPLGMSTPWAGYTPQQFGYSDWVHTPTSVVYSVAERVAAAHGFSYTWMAGQWPQTFPPCAGYF